MPSAVVSQLVPADAISVLDPLSVSAAVVDAQARLIHCNPAFVALTGLTSWRNSPLDVLDGGSGELRGLAVRAWDSASALTLHGFELASRDPPLRVTAAMSAWRERCTLLELHPAPSPEADIAPKISRSLRGLVHEVKNPLAGLRGAAQLLKRRLGDAEQLKLADLIIAEADRLAALADRLLQPAGKPHLSAINLHEVAERARALVVAEASAELTLKRDYDPSLPPLRGVGDRLLQLVLNLLRNAMQADAKNILVRTRIEHGAVFAAQPPQAALRLDVIDDGNGVPHALRDTLFLPLVSGRAGGTGLGLALAQEIAQEHGGLLNCRSRPGHTVFTLLLPFAGVDAHAQA